MLYAKLSLIFPENIVSNQTETIGQIYFLPTNIKELVHYLIHYKSVALISRILYAATN